MRNTLFLQRNRTAKTWICGVCDKVIHGTRNTIHLGVGSHVKSEIRKGLRKEPNLYGSRDYIDYGDREGDTGTIPE